MNTINKILIKMPIKILIKMLIKVLITAWLLGIALFTIVACDRELRNQNELNKSYANSEYEPVFISPADQLIIDIKGE